MDDRDKDTPCASVSLPVNGRASMDIAASMFVAALFDEQAYRTQVRRIPVSKSEKEYDDDFHQRALNEGIDLPHSLSEVTTTMSDTTNMHGSIMSQSTAPTSCSSSERRPETRNSVVSAITLPDQQSRSFASEAQKKRNSIFRSRVRRMVGKKKKASSDSWNEAATDMSDEQEHNNSQTQLDNTPPKTPTSIHSLKSSWSNQAVPAKTSSDFDQDSAALKRSLECRELLDLQKAQQAERDRFQDFRQRLIDQLQRERDNAKDERKTRHDAVMAAKQKTDDEALEELEEAQLQEEMKMAEEHRFWERMMHSRLRNIEKRVQNPTPPPTPGQAAATTDSESDSKAEAAVVLPVRRAAGPSEYTHLAEQYREQTSLLHSNGGKINVLRGQQQRKMEAFLGQQREETEALANQHKSEMDVIAEDYNSKMKALSELFAPRRALLELQWYKQALFEQQKQERMTGLKYQLLPMVSVND